MDNSFVNLCPMKKLISYLILFLVPVMVLAQDDEVLPSRPPSGGKRLEQPDTIRQKGIKKDESLPKITRQWTLSADYTEEIPTALDTSFSQFHRSRKTDKQSDFNIYPGNYGQPLYELNFFDREWLPDEYLYAHYKPYMFTPSNPVFMNTQVPFTDFLFTYGGSKETAEQAFSLRHSQNVNKDLNFGLEYDIIYNLGQYKYQRAKDKMFLFHASYNGEKYTSYFTAGINNLSVFENGGLESYADLENDPANLPVKLGQLSEAQSKLRNRHLMLIQRYSPGSRRDTTSNNIIKSAPVTLSLISVYEWNKRRFYDDYPDNSDFYDNSVYDTIRLDDRSTADSIFQGLFSNTFRIDFSAGSASKFRIGAGAGIRSELRQFGQLIPGDTITIPDEENIRKSSLILTGKVFNNIGDKFGWVATGDLWLQGYRAGDFIVNGKIFKDFTTSHGKITWNATGTMASYTPSFWYSSWSANRYLRDFDTSREIRLMAGSSIDYPAFRTSIRFNYALINNYIYFNRESKPEQYTGAVSIVSLALKKEFVVWKLHWDNSVLLQETSNDEVISLPLCAVKSSFFFDHTFRFKSTGGSFDFQLGTEVFYHTLYHSYAYQPVTGDYYNQNTTETGNYPFVNVFMNIKLKRTRFYIMFDHLNSGYSGHDYFLVPDYPMNIRMLRYGLAWTFYN